jgi:hypothetical protein
MVKLVNIFLSNVAHASPGTGHSHGAEGDSGSQVIGIVIIVAIAIAAFYFMSKKK